MDPVEKAILAIERCIAAVQADDYNLFVTLFTPRIQQRLNSELFQAAKDMHKRKPLSRQMIDPKTSQASPDGMVKLKMPNGRTLCTVIPDGDKLLVDNIFWK